jgi:hypothetical protein
VRGYGRITLLAAAASVALLPLYGDPRPTALVSHPEWARMVLRGLDLLADAPGVNDTAVQAFATLSGRESRAFPADGYARAQRVELVVEGGVERLRPKGGIGEAVYSMGIARQGDYRLRLHLQGTATAEAELTKAGEEAVLRRFGIAPAPVMSWVDAGVVHLEPGAYDTTVLLPEGSALEYLELAPPCVQPIEPPDGWKASGVTTADDVAVTVLEALDLESELPPAGPSLEFRGSDLRLEDGRAVVAPGLAGAFRGGPRGARVMLLADIPASGLYTLSVFGITGGGQRWLMDGCRTSLVCPATDLAPRWRVVLSGQLQKGLHVFAAALGPDTLVERLRFEPKKDEPADYVATVGRLGLELGAAGPVSRETAEEARRFLEQRRQELTAGLCGDIVRPGSLLAELASTGSGTAGGEAPGGPGGVDGTPGGSTPAGGGPVPPPVIPPLPPPSPVLPLAFASN